MTYKCLSCGHIFDEGEQKTYTERIGEFGCRPVYEDSDCCPCCGGAYKMTVECEICGGEHLENELTSGVCEECLAEYQHNPGMCYRISKAEEETEEIEINSFLASVFEPSEIEGILIGFIRSRMSDYDCSEYINQDKFWFADRLIKEVEKDENKKVKARRCSFPCTGN